MNFGSLFSGIGGIDLGLERAGMRCIFQVEIDDFCNKVLEKRWPEVPRYRDVRTFPEDPINRFHCDLLCGGFPCQDISIAGEGTGIVEGNRSGLRIEFARIIRVLRPNFVLVENVPAILLRGRGFGRVLGDLANLGYDAEWDVFSAAEFGAPHLRRRIFILAYPNGNGQPPPGYFAGSPPQGHVEKQKAGPRIWSGRRESGGFRDDRIRLCPGTGILRMDDGIPRRIHADRARSLGNAVVPVIAEYIGRKIIDTEMLKDNFSRILI